MSMNESAPAAPIAESAPAPETVSAPAPDGQAAPAAPNPPPEQREPSHARFQKRIDDLTRQRYDEQRAREVAEARLAELERERQQQTQFANIDAQQPRIDQFQSLEAYQAAWAQWASAKAAASAMSEWEKRMQERDSRAVHEARQRAQIEQQIAAENAAIEARMQEGVKKYPDFMDVLTDPSLPQVRGTALLPIVLHSEHAADIAYSLAKNPAELERLLSMHPAQAAREVYRLDAKFAGAPATSAPPPPPARNGSPATAKDWSDMSTKEHVDAYLRRNRNR